MKQPFLIHSNCFNNGVCSYFQRHLFPTIKDKLEYPKGGICGPIFENPQLGYILQYQFLKDILENPERDTLQKYKLFQDEFITTRISINFVFLLSSDFPILQTIGNNDEYELSSKFPELYQRPNLILNNFITSHLSYGLQEQYFKKVLSLLPFYENLSNLFLNSILFIPMEERNLEIEERRLEINKIGDERYKIRNPVNENDYYLQNVINGKYLYFEDNKIKLSNEKKTYFHFDKKNKTLEYEIFPFTKYNLENNNFINEFLYGKCITDKRECKLLIKDKNENNIQNIECGIEYSILLEKYNEYLIYDDIQHKIKFSKNKQFWKFFQVISCDNYQPEIIIHRILDNTKSHFHYIQEDSNNEIGNQYAGWKIENLFS